MKHYYVFPLLGSFFAFTSCSSISKEDCNKNMQAFGRDQGTKGKPNLLEDIRKSCSRGNPSIDLGAYQMGFEQGWNEYCTTFNGFKMGEKGDTYKSFCPPEKEDLFHEKFLIGKQVYEKKDQVKELQDKLMDLSEEGKDLTNPSIHDEMARLKDLIWTTNREIQSLEQKGKSLVHTDF
jgi:hypothetical protein